MKILNRSISLEPCSVSHIHSLLQLQQEVFDHLEDSSLLRRNSESMLLECLLPPHFAMGAFYKDQLVAIAILYIPTRHPDEALAPYLRSINGSAMRSANYKLCMVHPDYRGHHLQQHLGKKLEAYAIKEGFEVLCATISPYNEPSIRNLTALGYQYDCALTKYGHLRNLYFKTLLHPHRGK